MLITIGTMNNAIYLRRSRKIYFKPEASPVEPLALEYLAALQQNIEGLGFMLSPNLAEAMMALPIPRLKPIYQHLIADLKSLVGDKVQFKPMYPNFPEQVKNTPQSELYLNALWHYWGDAIGRRIMPLFEKLVRPPLTEPVPLKVIDLGTPDDFNQIFTHLAGAKTSLSDTDKADLVWFVKNRGDSIAALLPERIPLRENVALLGAGLLRYTGIAEPFLAQNVKTATDVLRLAVALSEGDISLAEPCKFISFAKKHRRLMLQLLESIPAPIEDMLRYPERWKRLGERLHPAAYVKRWPATAQAFTIIRNALSFATFASKVECSLKQKDVVAALTLLQQRPGELARRLDQLLRLSDTPYMVMQAFSQVAAQVATPLLLQLATHFMTRSQPSPMRVFFPKGNVGKLKAINNNLSALADDVCIQVALICHETLIERFRQLPPLGRVYLEPELNQFIVPFAQRSASKALHTIVRGSRLNLPPGDTIRFFIWWKDGHSRTDLDLSALALDENHIYETELAYYNLVDIGGCHSGDITSAPKGASEFIDIHLPSFAQRGIRYVLMTVNSFTTQAFCDLPECFAGFMMRQEPDSGEIYQPQTVANRFDLTANTTIAIPLIIDVKTRQVLWTDLALKRQPATNNNVINNMSSLTLLSQAMESLHKPNLYELFALHKAARGSHAAQPTEADTIFSRTTGITPFDTARIMAEFL